MTADLCPWCGHEQCQGDTPSRPHHNLCCLDGPRRPCWGKASGELDRIMREDKDDRWT